MNFSRVTEMYKRPVFIFCVIVYLKTVNCVAVNSNEEIFTTEISVGGKAKDDGSSDHIVEPTKSSTDGVATTNTNAKDIVQIESKTTKTSQDIEQPDAVSKWLKSLRKIEIENKKNGINGKDGIPESGQRESSLTITEEEIELPTPDELFKWLDNIPPLKKDKGAVIEHKSEKEHIQPSSNTHPETVQTLKLDAFDFKLIMILCATVGAVTLLIVVTTVYVIYKRRIVSKKIVDNRVDFPISNHKTQTVFNVEEKDNVFMGIPANNEIWKELQMLPSTASSVFPESEPVK